MSLLPSSRLTWTGLLLLAPGLYYSLRFSSGFVRVLSRKFRRGKPYLKGSASDYFLFACGSLLVALAGTALLAASLLQAGFQAIPAPRAIGTVTAETLQPGRMRLSFRLSKDYPRPRSLTADVPGVRWALEGESLRWRFGPRWLGFRPGHRIEAALGSSRPDGEPDRKADSRAIVSGGTGFSSLARRHGRWIPMVEIASRRTPWMPAEGGTYRIFAGAAGYVLVEEGPERRAP